MGQRYPLQLRLPMPQRLYWKNPLLVPTIESYIMISLNLAQTKCTAEVSANAMIFGSQAIGTNRNARSRVVAKEYPSPG